MAHVFDNNTPIYLQLQHIFEKKIVSGDLRPGDQMPTVREIAVQYGVNPNTVQRALTELEREGLAFSRRTSGRFITEDDDVIKQKRHHLAQQLMAAFISNMTAFGYTFDELVLELKTNWRDEHGND